MFESEFPTRTGALTIQSTPNVANEENDLFGVATAVDGATWAVGWALDIAAVVHAPLILQGLRQLVRRS
jgi:hypothetical protein